MQNFVYEFYRLYPNNIIDNTFIINGNTYRLLPILESENEVLEKVKINEYLKTELKINPINLCKNIKGEYLSNYYQVTYVLLVYRPQDITIENILYINYASERTTNQFDFRSTVNLWEKKVQFVENLYLPTLNIKDPNYEYYLTTAFFYLGLAENAIQYLVDMIHDKKDVISHVCLSHKRVNYLNYFDCYNPFNLFYDSRIRDLAEMYKYRFLDVEKLIYICKNNKYDESELNFLFARILFPTHYFDALEIHYFEKKNITEHIITSYFNIAQEKQTLQQLYLKFNQIVSVRPIEWLLEK